MLVIFAIAMTAPAVSALAQQTQSSDSSVSSSKVSDIPATPVPADDGLRRACAEAVQELKAARMLIDGQAAQIAQAEKLLKIQIDIESKLRELGTLNDEEKASLYRAIDAKDRAIAALEQSNRELRKKGGGFWGKLKIGVMGAAVGLIAGAVL